MPMTLPKKCKQKEMLVMAMVVVEEPKLAPDTNTLTQMSVARTIKNTAGRTI
jgi:hypothetical protein